MQIGYLKFVFVKPIDLHECQFKKYIGKHEKMLKSLEIFNDKIMNISAAPISSFSMNKGLPKSCSPAVVNGIGQSTQVRLFNTSVPICGISANDMEVPNFDEYRKSGTKDATKSSNDSEGARKNFTYVMSGSMGVITTYGAMKTVSTFLGYLSASRDVLAMAKIEIKLGDIPAGKNMTFKWRGKPLFIRHRYSVRKLHSHTYFKSNHLLQLETKNDCYSVVNLETIYIF